VSSALTEYRGTALITGASQGIGLELTRQYAFDQWRVFAACRKPEAANSLSDLASRYPREIKICRMDVAEDGEIADLGHALAEESIDLIISNAGWGDGMPHLSDLTYAAWERSMRVNAFAFIKIAQVFSPHLTRGQRKLLIAVGSQMGSIAENVSGGRYAYRASKAALNMIVRNLAIDLRHRGIISVSLHPGWVRTRMGGPSAPLAVDESAAALRKIINGLTLNESGKFLSYEGREIPW
jgi:NAD(P)-dependent dehydrogenase (short-subunit alcohol dehydrogenase family)